MRQMLTLHSVNPTGMFSYGLCDSVNLLNNGLVHLIGINEDKGGSNGSGKSSLFNAICELLFQENPTGENGDAVINDVWAKGMAGRLYFTNWQGQHFRVTYCRDWKGQLYPVDNDNGVSYVGTSLYLDKYEDGVWKDSRGSGMPETHKKLLETVGMTYSQFISTSYMSHRIGDQFLRGKNKERLDILSGVVGLEEWDQILEQCRAKKKALLAKSSSIGDKVSYEKGSIKTLEEQFQNARAFNWDNHIQVLTERLEATRAAWKAKNNEISKMNAQIQNLRDQQEKSVDKTVLDAIRQEIADLNNLVRSKEQEFSNTLPIMEDQKLALDLRNCANFIGQSRGALSAYCGSLRTLDSAANCPTCEAEIGEDVRQKLREKVDALNADIFAKEKAYANLQELIKKDKEEKLQVERDRKSSISNEVANIRKSIDLKNASIRNLYEEYEKLNQSIKLLQNELSKLTGELNSFNMEGSQINSQIATAKASVENLKALEGQIEEKSRQVKFYEDEIKDVNNELLVFVWLIDNIPYIKLHKMSMSMAEISDMVNSYFDEMGETTRLRISSFEEKTKKKHASDVKDLMKSEVKVEIIDGNKNISPNLYSDGEISKISMAVVRALHELANKKGQGCNLMMLDEIFSFIDKDNSQKISEGLTSLLNRGTIFLTDNSGGANNLVQFNKVWIARKRNGQTALELE